MLVLVGVVDVGAINAARRGLVVLNVAPLVSSPTDSLGA